MKASKETDQTKRKKSGKTKIKGRDVPSQRHKQSAALCRLEAGLNLLMTPSLLILHGGLLEKVFVVGDSGYYQQDRSYTSAGIFHLQNPVLSC
jgi:hypothetical protein